MFDAQRNGHPRARIILVLRVDHRSLVATSVH
jgi:hypothetical protein